MTTPGVGRWEAAGHGAPLMFKTLLPNVAPILLVQAKEIIWPAYKVYEWFGALGA